MRRYRKFPSLIAAGAWLVAAGAVHAQTTLADLGGTWFPARYIAGSTTTTDETLRRLLTPRATLLREAAPPLFEYPRGEFGGLQLSDDALQSALRWQPDAEPSLSSTCTPASIVQAMASPFPFEVNPASQLLVIRLEYFDLVRLVFMDGRPHPGPEYPHSTTGHSIGRWRNGILTVDTTHLSPSVLTSNGVAHTRDMHVVERFRLGNDGKTLHYMQEFDDPSVLKAPGARYAQFMRQPGSITPYECDPGYAASIQKREGSMSDREAKLVQELLEQTRQSQRDWVNGDSTTYADERLSHSDRFSLFGPFGGPSPTGWTDEVAKGLARVAKDFEGGTSAIDLVQSYVSGDLVVLVTVERNEVKFTGHGKPVRWDLRTTQVYERDLQGRWKVIHRHADPLLSGRTLEQTLRLLVP